MNQQIASQVDQVRYSTFACTNCRNSHRKCDKVLDVCGYCKRTNKTCCYVAPPERKPRKRKASSSSEDESDVKRVKLDPVSTAQAIMDNYKSILPNSASISECINAYYSLFSTGIPLLECELGYKVMDKVNNNSVVNDDGSVYNVDLPSLYLFISAQILSLQRLGKRNLASKLYAYLIPLLTRELFTSLTDSAPADGVSKEQLVRLKLLTSSLATLSYYASGSVGVDSTLLMIQNGRYLLQKLKKSLSDAKFADLAVSMSFKKLEVYFRLAEFTAFQYGDNVMEYLKLLLQSVKERFPYADTSKIMKLDEATDILNTVATSEHLTDTSILLAGDFVPPSVISLLRVAFRLAHIGVTMMFMMQKGGYENQLIQIANKQSDLITAERAAFKDSPAFVIRPIVLISLVHIQHCSSDKQRLEQDLRAMKLLVDRFDLVTEKYSSVITELERAILKEEQVTQQTEQIPEFLDDNDYSMLFKSMFENPYFILQPELMNVQPSTQGTTMQYPITPTFGSPDNLSFLHNLDTDSSSAYFLPEIKPRNTMTQSNKPVTAILPNIPPYFFQ